MERIIGLIILLVIIWSIKRYRALRQEQKEEEYNDNSQDSMNTQQENSSKEEPDTRELMVNALTQLGCQPEKNDDGSLLVQYQGETFLMKFRGMYARIWDPAWADIRVDDPDLPQMREAVNSANFNFGPTVVMTEPDDGVIDFHSRIDIMMHPACPDNPQFIQAILHSFFDTKQNVRNSYHQLKDKQQETQKNRRPIGFATNKEE